MPSIDRSALALELLAAHTSGAVVETLPSSRDDAFDLSAAYAVEAEITRLRGRETVGLKVGFANKAMWRVLKIETLLWAHMYEDTVHYASGGTAELALPYYRQPKLEPEIVFGLKQPMAAGGLDAPAVLESVDWLAVGFEIIDCPYPEWKFKAVDFVAALGLHVGLVVGPPLRVDSARIAELVTGLAACKVRVSKNGQFVEEGFGKNSLRSPALCLAELAGGTPLSAGDLISSGTLTSGHPIARGETWQVEVEGLPLAGLTVRLT